MENLNAKSFLDFTEKEQLIILEKNKLFLRTINKAKVSKNLNSLLRKEATKIGFKPVKIIVLPSFRINFLEEYTTKNIIFSIEKMIKSEKKYKNAMNVKTLKEAREVYLCLFNLSNKKMDNLECNFHLDEYHNISGGRNLYFLSSNYYKKEDVLQRIETMKNETNSKDVRKLIKNFEFKNIYGSQINHSEIDKIFKQFRVEKSGELNIFCDYMKIKLTDIYVKINNEREKYSSIDFLREFLTENKTLLFDIESLKVVY